MARYVELDGLGEILIVKPMAFSTERSGAPSRAPVMVCYSGFTAEVPV